MDKFKAPKTLVEFIERTKSANVKATPVLISALQLQRNAKVKDIDEEITFHQQVLAYLTTGVEPEGLQ